MLGHLPPLVLASAVGVILAFAVASVLGAIPPFIIESTVAVARMAFVGAVGGHRQPHGIRALNSWRRQEGHHCAACICVAAVAMVLGPGVGWLRMCDTSHHRWRMLLEITRGALFRGYPCGPATSRYISGS